MGDGAGEVRRHPGKGTRLAVLSSSIRMLRWPRLYSLCKWSHGTELGKVAVSHWAPVSIPACLSSTVPGGTLNSTRTASFVMV